VKMAAATTELELSLPTFVIGPEAQGRGYQVLAPDRFSFPGAQDLAMVLMEWSRAGEQELAGRLPPRGRESGAIVFRARHISSRALGQAAYLNGVLVQPEQLAALDHRAELLLPLIPAPDGSTRFADRPLTIAQPSPIPPLPWNGLGLAWRDCQILASAERREDLLLRALASIDPPEQRARITGWVTSNRLVSRGSLDPLGEAQLIVGDAAAAENAPELVRWTEAGGTAATPPDSWTVWRDFLNRFATTSKFGGLAETLRWRPEYAPLKAEEVAAEALRLATSVLPAQAMTELIESALGAGYPFDVAAMAVATDYVEALQARGSAESVVHRLWAATERSSSLTRMLLRFTDNARRLDLAASLRAARTALQEGALADDRAARLGFITLMKAAVDSPNTKIDILAEIFDDWPNTAKIELFALTALDSFEMMWRKSRHTSERLALKIFRSDCYAFGARGEGNSVTVQEPSGLQGALRAIKKMRAG
jgi:hypothetical protein